MTIGANSPQAIRDAGQQALEAGRFGDAAALFARLSEIAPTSLDAWCGLSAAQFSLGDMAAALAAAKRAQSIAPTSLQPLHVLAPAASCTGDQLAVTQCFGVLPQIPKQHAGGLTQYWVQRLSERERFAEAVAASDAFIEAHQPNYLDLVKHAELLINASQPEKAVDYIERALAVQPGAADAHTLRARCYLQTGNIPEARSDLLKAIELDHSYVSAYAVLADVDINALDDQMTAHLAELLDNSAIAGDLRTLAGSALGRAREARGDYDGAFTAFTAANEISRSAALTAGRGYDRRAAEEAIRTEVTRFPAAVVNAPLTKPDRGKDLIFITGLPRSGSTLIDQILASHSQVESAGECMALARLYEAILARSTETGADIPTTIDRHADEWEEHYRSGLRLSAGAQVIVDKSLQNFWFYGVIARLFPAAQILEMHRDPMDVGLSIYRLMFLGAHIYANSLEDIGHYYKCFESMTEYWRSLMPDRIRIIEYEEFIADPATNISELLEHCGLSMEEACLNFHKTSRPVNTLSAAQVRQGITTSGRGRWRAYEKHLEPLRRTLDTVVIPRSG